MLVTDESDAGVLGELFKAAVTNGVTVELVAPKVGGVTLSDGQLVPAQQKIDGGPSVLYDIVAVLAAGPQAEALANNAAAKDFVSDAYAHAKFVGYVEGATELIGAAGVVPDDGFVRLDEPDGVTQFFSVAAHLRLWAREAFVHQI